MVLRAHLRSGVGVLAVVLPLLAAGGAAASDRHLSLSYRVYVGGFRTIDVAFQTRLAPHTYAMRLKLEARGMLNWFFTWSMVAASQGRIDGGRVIPVHASTASTWAGSGHRITIDFPRNGTPVATVRPRDTHAVRDPVPRAVLRGTRDLAGAIMASLRAIGETGRCGHSEKVFDGRRRYDLLLTDLGAERLAPSDYSAFSGRALKCRLSIRRIAGFRKQRSHHGWARSDHATVWIAKVFPDTRPVPVRIDQETLFGDLHGYLAEATLTGDGPLRRLRLPQ